MIYLEKENLEKNILELDTKNKLIVEAMNYIYKEITNIDHKDWYSPEKDRIDNNFIPYIKEQYTKKSNGFEDKINALRNALALYREQDEIELPKKVEHLEVLK